MRFMVIVKADTDSEAGVLPSQQILTEMGKYNEELVKAGVMLAGEGLQPSSKGARVKFSGSKRIVSDGPFAETKELIAGFWLWQCRSKQEAMEWLKRAPFDGGTEVEIRQVFEAEDFGAEFTPELREQEERQRAQADRLAKSANRQKITTFLWFDGNAEEAVNFYTSIFRNSRVLSLTRYGDAFPGLKGKVMSITFQLEGQQFIALNGGPQYKFTEAISLFVSCEHQGEVDDLWQKLTAGGEPGRCGWLKDKFGLSWQIIPTVLGEMLQDKGPESAKSVTEAMLQMDKLDIARLEQAYDQR